MSIKLVWAIMTGTVAFLAIECRDDSGLWVLLGVLMLAGLVF